MQHSQHQVLENLPCRTPSITKSVMKTVCLYCSEMMGPAASQASWSELRNEASQGAGENPVFPKLQELASILGITVVLQRSLFKWTHLWLQISLLRSRTHKHLSWSCTEHGNVFVWKVLLCTSTRQAQTRPNPSMERGNEPKVPPLLRIYQHLSVAGRWRVRFL